MIQTTKTGYVIVGAIIAIASLTIIGSVIANYEALAGKYGEKNNQANSGTNSCGNEFFPNNVLCSNTDSQVQGDENAVAITSLQEAPSSAIDGIVNGFLKIKTAIVEPFGQDNPPTGNTMGGLNAFLITHGLIPENGEGGAFGYGILTTNTESGDGSLIVATTHGGVLDSAEQSSISDPAWHNHMVTLKEDAANCGTDPAVDRITWEEPGQVLISGKTASLVNIPNQFSSPSSFDPSGPDQTFEPGNDVQQVVSFRLVPVPPTGGSAPDGTLQAVCVTEITPAENLIIR